MKRPRPDSEIANNANTDGIGDLMAEHDGDGSDGGQPHGDGRGDVTTNRGNGSDATRAEATSAFRPAPQPTKPAPVRVKSTELSRAQLIRMIGRLRGVLFDGDLTSEERTTINNVTSFDVIGEDLAAVEAIDDNDLFPAPADSLPAGNENGAFVLAKDPTKIIVCAMCGRRVHPALAHPSPDVAKCLGVKSWWGCGTVTVKAVDPKDVVPMEPK